MNNTRRKVLLIISQLAAAATLGACSKSSQEPGGANQDLELLASVAYDILPFPELAPAIYVQVAGQVQQSPGSDVAAGLEQLRAATSGTAWQDLDESTRLDVLASMQDGPFFRALRGATIQVVLRDPAARQLVGYGGSAIEHGGYLHRGFDDISWLPAAQTN